MEVKNPRAGKFPNSPKINISDKPQDDDMACGHVGKKSDGKSKWLCKDADQLNNQHDWLYENRNTRVPKNVFPVSAFRAKICYDEC